MADSSSAQVPPAEELTSQTGVVPKIKENYRVSKKESSPPTPTLNQLIYSDLTGKSRTKTIYLITGCFDK
jgi:hypothetical protein